MKLIVAGVLPDGRSGVVESAPIPDLSKERAQPISASAGEHAGRSFPLFRTPDNPPKIERPTSEPALGGGPGSNFTSWSLMYMPPRSGAKIHRTNVLSYSVVLSGSIDLILESEPVRLEAGDCLVCPGVMHGWATEDEGALLSTSAIGLGSD